MAKIVDLAHRATKVHPNIFKGKVLTIVSPAVEEMSELESLWAQYLAHKPRVPWLLRRTYAVLQGG